jgi:sugar/nucleoside kinase (ribokinase family)
VIFQEGIMARGLFVGLTTVDIFNIVDTNPLPDRKIKAQRQEVYGGGPAANAAVAFCAWGNEADLFTGIGSHPTANLAIDDLQNRRINVLDYAANPDELPILSTIIIDSSTGNRCVVYSSPQARTLVPDQRYDHLVGNCQVILFDGFYLEQAVSIAKAADGGSLTVLDGGSWKDGLEELLPYIDYAICSADFSPPGISSHDDLLNYLEDIGVQESAISRGPMPIIYRTRGRQDLIPVPRVKAIDTLGAGDILHGTFCHHILANSFPKSLEMAAYSASRSCLSFGTREWINNIKIQGQAYEIRKT